MRIISKFRDYYDVVQSQGQADDLVFLRNKDKELLRSYTLPILRYRIHRSTRIQPSGHIIGFCGKLYPVVYMWTWQNWEGRAVEGWCYNADEARAWVHNHLRKDEVKAYEAGSKKKWWKGTGGKPEIEEFFQKVDEEQTKHAQLFEDYGPIFHIPTHKYDRTNSAVEIEINPTLKEFEFYRVLDTYSTFQELTMYLGSRARPEKKIPEVSNADMIEAKGFDRKTSFRKPKSRR